MAGSRQDIRAGRAYVEIGAKMSGLEKGLAKAEARLRQFGSRAQALGRGLLSAGAAAGAPLAFASRTAANFQDEMAKVKAISGANEQEFAALRAEAERLGSSTSYSASEAAGGMKELAKAGFSVEETLQTIPGLLDLARGSETDLAQATEIAANVLRSFQIPASQSARVMDVLAATATSASTDVELIGETMKYIAPFAQEAGVSLESTAASLALLANNGIKGSQAGTAMARILKNLSRTPVQEKLRALGIEAADAAGNLRAPTEILRELDAATAGMGSAGRLALFEQLFGRGAGAALKMASSGKKIDEMRTSIENSEGATARMAATMDDTLGGSFRMLTSSVEGLQIAIGDALTPTLTTFMGYVRTWATDATAWVKANKEIVVSVGALAAVTATAGTALIAIGTLAKAVAFAVSGARAAGAALGATKAVLTALLGFGKAGVTAALAALGKLPAAIAALKAAGGISAALATVKAAMLAAAPAVLAFAAAFAAVGYLVYKAWKYLADIRYIAKVEEDIRRTEARIKEMNAELLKTQRLRGLGAHFTADQARKDVQALIADLAAAGKTEEEIREQLRGGQQATAPWLTNEWTEKSGYTKEAFAGYKNEFTQMNRAYADALDSDLAALIEHNRDAETERDRANRRAVADADRAGRAATALEPPSGVDLQADMQAATSGAMDEWERRMAQGRAKWRSAMPAGAPAPGAGASVPSPDEAMAGMGVGGARQVTAAMAQAQQQTNDWLSRIHGVLDTRLGLG